MTFQYSTNTLHSALQVVRLRVPSWRPVLCWMPVLRWMPVQSWMPTRKCMHWVKTHTLSTTISTIVLFARLSQVIVTAQLQPNTKMVWPHNAVEPTHHHHTNFEGTSRQPMNLIFGMQPYFGLHQILNMKTKVVVTWPSLPLGLCNFNPTAKTFNALPGNLGSSKNHPKTSLNWLWHNSKLT